jgi:hypothetical protein
MSENLYLLILVHMLQLLNLEKNIKRWVNEYLF